MTDKIVSCDRPSFMLDDAHSSPAIGR